MRISKSRSETYTMVKSLGRLVVKDGLSSDPDIPNGSTGTVS